MKKRYTFDTTHRDGFPRLFLIRFARNDEDDSFETFEECKKVLNKSLSADVFVSLEVLSSLGRM